MRAVEEKCAACEKVGASASASGARVRYGDKEATDVNLYGQTANMADIDTRTVEYRRYFTASEADHRTTVTLIGDTGAQHLFPAASPPGKALRPGDHDLTVPCQLATFARILAQAHENFGV